MAEYDLDLTGGLMEEIERLTAPPQSEETNKGKKREHAYYKKPGKPHNHDLCDSCGEGGDLLCCDKCPASFHMECQDPPLDDDEIPMGEWICHRCKSRPKVIEEDAASTCSNKSKHSETSALSKKSSRKPSPIPMAISDYDIVQEVRQETVIPRHPLQILAKAASLMNPKQFEIPKELNCPVQLPGSSKKKWWVKDPPGKNVPGKKASHELDNGMVPLPAKVCFTCSKSCRKAPLLQCDYCPLLFHLDCLNPPLTTMPQGRWMCPNHCEHVLDEKLLKSMKLTERVKLWDQFTGPVNQQQCKINFLNKIHRKNPPFQIKKKHTRKMMIKVPQAIKSQYQLPPSLLPKLHGLPTTMNGHRVTSEEEQNQWLSGIISLHSSIISRMSQKQHGIPLPDTGSSTETEDDSAMDTAVATATTAPTSTSSSSAFVSSNLAFMSSTTTTESGKPTASVTPVLKQDINSNSFSSSASSSNQDNEDGSRTSKLTNNKFGDNSVSEDKMEVVGAVPSGCEVGSVGEVSGPCKESLFNGLSSSMKGVVEESEAMEVSSETFHKTGSEDLVNYLVENSVNRERLKNTDTDIPEGGDCGVSNKMETSETTVNNHVYSTNNTFDLSCGDNNFTKTELSSKPDGNKQAVTSSTDIDTEAIGGSLSSSRRSSIEAESRLCKLGVRRRSNRSSSSQHSREVAEMSELQSLIQNKQEVDIAKLDPNLVKFLAMQQIKKLLSPAPENVQAPVKKSVVLDATNQIGSPDVRARAVLCSLSGSGQSVPMAYRNLTIGTGADMDVCLRDFGECCFVSPKHACIFYDEATRHFELLNYSDHGTTVDNVLYSCDFSEKPAVSGPTSKLVSSVRKLVKKSKSKKIKEEPDTVKVPVEDQNKDFMSGSAYTNSTNCSCKTSSSSLIGGSGAGWEGTALLHHGSYIKLGCVQFVFSVVEQATRHPIIIQRPDDSNTIEIKQEIKEEKFD